MKLNYNITLNNPYYFVSFEWEEHNRLFQIEELERIKSFLENISQIDNGTEKLSFVLNWIKNHRLTFEENIDVFMPCWLPDVYGLVAEVDFPHMPWQIIVYYCLLNNNLIIYSGLRVDDLNRLEPGYEVLNISASALIDFYYWKTSIYEQYEKGELKDHQGVVEFDDIPTYDYKLVRPIYDLVVNELLPYWEQKFARTNYWEDEDQLKALYGEKERLERKMYAISMQLDSLRTATAKRGQSLQREILEISYLERLNAADSSDSIQAIIAELARTPMDADLRKRLTKLAEEKRAIWYG